MIPPKFWPRARALAPLVPVLLVYLLYLLVLLVYARSVISFPFDYDQGEGFELYDAVRLARGQNIYLDNAVFPYYASNYPPVYRTLLVPLVWLFGPKLALGRIVALAATFGVAVIIFMVTRRAWRGDRLTGTLVPLLGALAFLAANYVYHVAPLARAHLPMVAFACAGIACLDHGLRNFGPPTTRDWRWTILGVALLMTAAFTKLQAVDALVAGFGFLLLRRPRWCLPALALCAAFSAALALWLNTASGGQFWLNVVSANVNEYDIAITWKTYAQWFGLQGILIVCAVALVLWDLARAVRVRSFAPLGIWSLYFVAGSALGMLTGKWGAGPTYLVAAIAASCVCTVLLLGRIADHWRLGPGAAAWLVALVFAGQAALNVHLPTSGRFFGPLARLAGVADLPSSYPPYPYYDRAGYVQLGHLLDAQDTLNGRQLVNELKQHPGPVWSEEAMWTLYAGKDVVTNPTQLLNLSRNGTLDTRDMIARIERHEFGAVVFRAFFYPEDVKRAIMRNYDFVGSIKINGFDYFLLLPKK